MTSKRAAGPKPRLALTLCAVLVGGLLGHRAARTVAPSAPAAPDAVSAEPIRPGLPAGHRRRDHPRCPAHRTVTVVVALDQDLSERPGMDALIDEWLDAASLRLSAAAPITLHRVATTSFRVCHVAPLRDLASQHSDPAADIVLGIVTDEHGEEGALGRARAYRYAFVEMQQTLDENATTIAHEMAHLFGAWHETPSRAWLDSEFGPSAAAVIEIAMHRDFTRGAAGLPLRARRRLEGLWRRSYANDGRTWSPLAGLWDVAGLQARIDGDPETAARAFRRSATLLRRNPRTRHDAHELLADAASALWQCCRWRASARCYERAAAGTRDAVVAARYRALAERSWRALQVTSDVHEGQR